MFSLYKLFHVMIDYVYSLYDYHFFENQVGYIIYIVQFKIIYAILLHYKGIYYLFECSSCYFFIYVDCVILCSTFALYCLHADFIYRMKHVVANLSVIATLMINLWIL